MEPKKNILFLITDQQRYDTITSRFCLTPNIDSLATAGTMFDRAYSVNAICSPARASFMTGKFPHNHGMVDNSHTVESFRSSLIRDGKTFPEHLKVQGYTLGYFGKWHVDRVSDLDSFGFSEHLDENEIPAHKRTIFSKKTVSHPGYNDRLLYGVHEESSKATEEYFIYSKGIEFIEKSTQDKAPWCLFISTNAPHDPYIPPKDMYDLYHGVDLPLPLSFKDSLDDRPTIYRRIQKTLGQLDEGTFKEMARCYYALCSLVDAQVGRVMEVLRELDQMESTVIVFMSDHGDLLGAHRLFCKGIPAFNDGYHIPLIIKDTQLEKVKRTSIIASTIDIFPTVLELAHCEPLTGIDGESLVPFLDGRMIEDRVGYAEFYGQRFSATQRIVWKGDWKYVFNGFDEDELYNLGTDPFEMVNLANNPIFLPQLQDMCREMWKKAKASNDNCFLESEYYMFRFAPLGPEKSQKPSVYNKDA
jgi:choline-sulfatase